MSLQVAVGNGPAKELLEHPVGGNSGECLAEMGVFGAGKLTISFIIGALKEIKQAATFVVEDTTHVTEFRPPPSEPLKSLKQGETWSDTGTFDAGKESID